MYACRFDIYFTTISIFESFTMRAIALYYLFRTHNVCTVGTTTAQFDVLFMQFHFLLIPPFLD